MWGPHRPTTYTRRRTVIIKMIDDDTVHFYTDQGVLLLSENIREVIRPELLEELEAEE